MDALFLLGKLTLGLVNRVKTYVYLWGAGIAAVIYLLYRYAPDQVSKMWIIPAILVALFLGLLALRLSPDYRELQERAENPFYGYAYAPKTGLLKNSKDGMYYCVSCHSKGTRSLLREQEDGSWQCPNVDCGAVYGQKQEPSFVFDEAMGVYRETESGILYCASCYANGKKTPLKKIENGWLCVDKNCKTFYPEPGFRKPGIQSMRRPGGVNFDGYS